MGSVIDSSLELKFKEPSSNSSQDCYIQLLVNTLGRVMNVFPTPAID